MTITLSGSSSPCFFQSGECINVIQCKLIAETCGRTTKAIYLARKQPVFRSTPCLVAIAFRWLMCSGSDALPNSKFGGFSLLSGFTTSMTAMLLSISVCEYVSDGALGANIRGANTQLAWLLQRPEVYCCAKLKLWVKTYKYVDECNVRCLHHYPSFYN